MDRQKATYKVTIVGTVSNLILVIFKLIAGIVGHSSAMIADAVHSISDFVTDIVVLIFVKIAAKPKDCDHNYGHGKYETLATAIIGILLLLVGIGIFIDAAKKIYSYLLGNELEAPGLLALIAALISIAIKEVLYRYTVYVGRKIDSQVVIANAWHHRSDAFSSIATAIGISGAIVLGVKWRVLDPIAALIVSVLIAKVAFQLFVPSINELLEKSLPASTEHKILEIINSYPEVSQPHNLRTRRIGPISSVEFHVRMDPDLTVRASHDVTLEIENAIRQYLGPETIINVHVEPRK